MTGYLRCRSCGTETNCADLVSGFCPVCAKIHVAALAAGDPAASERVAALISEYEQSERVRLKDAVHDRHLNRVSR